jgi:hypothetical protein
MHRHLIRATFMLAAVLAVLTLASAPVAARTTPFSSTYDETTTDTSCGFPLERHSVGKAFGRSSPDRFDVTNAGVDTLTNLENGLSVTLEYQALFKNANFVDNEDGTVTLDQTTVGASTLYGPNGEVLLRSHGPMTIHITFIPPDEEHDLIIISQEILFEHGSHPSTELFCQTVAAALGVAV